VARPAARRLATPAMLPWTGARERAVRVSSCFRNMGTAAHASMANIESDAYAGDLFIETSSPTTAHAQAAASQACATAPCMLTAVAERTQQAKCLLRPGYRRETLPR
jgi:hypothetical protein